MNVTSRYWMLTALLLACLPHASRLPLGLDAFLLIAMAWRFPALERRLPLPGKWALVIMLFGGIAALRGAFNTLFGPEAGVALLIFCAGMKLLETRVERDRYVMLVLAVFVLATIFLFEQGLGYSLYVLLALSGIIAAFIAQNMPGRSPAFMLRKSAVLMGQAIPLMIVLFLFFPRLPPLWSMKLTDATGRTGMSDTMSPGDLAKLGQSDELAFRVEFPGNKVPPKSMLYWRGLTFSRFDGKTWRPSVDYRMEDGGDVSWYGSSMPSWIEPAIRLQDKAYTQYKVILEPTDHNWLYTLSIPYPASADVGLTRDFRLVNRSPVFQRLSYDVQWFKPAKLDPDLPDWMRRENLWLPSAGNPSAKKMAKEWRSYYGSDIAYMSALLRWFNRSAFVYTLDPPPLGDNRIDEFLFKTHRGFCEHYASSFTFLLRAAGIPARVVVGYQGGEPSPTGDSWQVRQMDAHAWVEAWLPETGWRQIDPTAAVSPERIERGMSGVAQSQQVWGNSAISLMHYGNFRLLGNLRNMMDYVNYRWQKDVLGFDTENQEAFLSRWLGDATLWKRLAIGFGALAVLIVGLAAWTMLRHRISLHPADRVVERLSKRLTVRGLQRHNGEGVLDWMARLEHQQPQWGPQVKLFSNLYARLRYAPLPEGQLRGLVSELGQLLRTWPAYRAQKTQEIKISLADGDGSS